VRGLVLGLLVAACSQGARLDAPPGIVALRPAPDFAAQPDAEILIVVDPAGHRDSDAAQAVAAQIAQRVPDLVVTASGRGVYDYGTAHVDVQPHAITISHSTAGTDVRIDVGRLRDIAGTTVVRLRKQWLTADTYDANGQRVPSAEPVPVRHARVQ